MGMYAEIIGSEIKLSGFLASWIKQAMGNPDDFGAEGHVVVSRMTVERVVLIGRDALENGIKCPDEMPLHMYAARVANAAFALARLIEWLAFNNDRALIFG